MSQGKTTTLGMALATALGAEFTTATAAYTRAYPSDLKADDGIQVVVTPIAPKRTRAGWGSIVNETALGVVVMSKLTGTSAGTYDATQLDALELLVDSIMDYLLDAIKLDTNAVCVSAEAEYGDHYTNHLTEKDEFHVPITTHWKMIG